MEIKASDDDPNVFRIAAAKKGSKSFGADGKKFTFTEEALIGYANSWEGGIITLNHEYKDDGGKIIASFYDPETELVYQDIRVGSAETARRTREGEPTGVSIEANVLNVDDSNNILEFGGTGVSLIFYPEMPACPLRDGCGVLAKDQFQIKASDISDSRSETITASNLDMARVNNVGMPVKIDTVVLWHDEDYTKEEMEELVVRYASYQGPGTYIFVTESDMEIGDILPDIDNPEYTVNITVSDYTPVGGTIVSQSNTKEPEMVSKEEYDAALAKAADLESQLEKAKASDELKKKDVEIAAKDAEIETYKKEIQARDDEKAQVLVKEIQAIDADYDPSGKSLAEIQEMHAFASKLQAKISASTPAGEEEAGEEEAGNDEQVEEEEEFVEASFQAPTGDGSGNSLTIGGIGLDGKWIGGGGVVPTSAFVPHEDE